MAERVVERDDAAPGRDARVVRRSVVHERGAHARAQAIGADDDRAALHPAADQAHGDRILVLVESRALGAEANGVGAERPEQYGLQAGAVDEDERGAEAILEPRRDRRAELRAPPAAEGGVVRGGARRLDRVAHAEAAQGLDRVGPQRDARADLVAAAARARARARRGRRAAARSPSRGRRCRRR